jgi:hypothetical protein
MFQVEADKSAKLLKISYADQVGPADTRKALESVKTLAVDLQPGFRLLTDLSSLEAMDLACLADIKKMMDFLNKKGVDTVVRVIPDPKKDIGLNILSLFHYRRGVHIVTCATLAEAALALAD